MRAVYTIQFARKSIPVSSLLFTVRFDGFGKRVIEHALHIPSVLICQLRPPKMLKYAICALIGVLGSISATLVSCPLFTVEKSTFVHAIPFWDALFGDSIISHWLGTQLAERDVVSQLVDV